MIGIYNIVINGETPGSIVVNGNVIEGTYKQGALTPAVGEWINGHGCESYPAGIDPHVHDRWGEPEREDTEHLEAACIEGGVGTIVVMPNTKPPYDRAEQTTARLSGFNTINVLAWMAATRTNYNERCEVHRFFPGLIPGSKLMMASTNNPETLVDDDLSQRRILEENADIGCITTIHAEAEDLINRNRLDYQRMSRQLMVAHHCKVRASPVEVEGIRRILNIHRDVGGRIHIAHVSTVGGIELILDAKARGQLVTFETCPHYWMLNDSWIERQNGGDYKMNPALRPPAEQQRVFEYFCSGAVDLSATDHAPHPSRLKTLPGLDECPSGVPGVETNIPLVYRLKQRGDISAKQFVDLTSRHAAQILGLNKGELKAGFDADIILLDPRKTETLADDRIKSKCGWTPYRGEEVSPVALMIVGGQIVKNDLDRQ